MIAAVGQQMDFRRVQVGIGEDAHEAFAVSGKRPRFRQFIIFGEHPGGGLGHALLQEQVRGPERGAGQEAPLHGVVQQQIRQSQQAHPLVMGHERADGDAGLVRGQTRRRVIHRFVKTVSAFAAFGGQPLQVLAGFPGRDHQRQRRGVRSNDQVLGQASFQTQARHAKGAVLVVQMDIGPVVARFGNAPRHAAQFAVLDLLLHRRLCRCDRAKCFRSWA